MAAFVHWSMGTVKEKKNRQLSAVSPQSEKRASLTDLTLVPKLRDIG
jgi:hypothetical protein